MMDLEELTIELDRRIEEARDDFNELERYADNEDYEETVERLVLEGRIDGLSEARDLLEELA
jgi:hypothetical protein